MAKSRFIRALTCNIFIFTVPIFSSIFLYFLLSSMFMNFYLLLLICIQTCTARILLRISFFETDVEVILVKLNRGLWPKMVELMEGFLLVENKTKISATHRQTSGKHI